MKTTELTTEQIDILRHTAHRAVGAPTAGRYCGDSRQALRELPQEDAHA